MKLPRAQAQRIFESSSFHLQDSAGCGTVVIQRSDKHRAHAGKRWSRNLQIELDSVGEKAGDNRCCNGNIVRRGARACECVRHGRIEGVAMNAEADYLRTR